MGVPIDFKDAEFNIRDMANQELVGKVNHQTIKLGMFTDPDLIAWRADRFLRLGSYPFANISFTANRNIFKLDPGDAFVLNYAPYSISGMVCRVQVISEDGPETEEIRVRCVEDVNYMTEEVAASAIYTSVEPRDFDLLEITDLDVFELPYVLAGKELRVATVAGRKTMNDLGYLVYMSIDGGSSYNRVGTSNRFTPHGRVSLAAYPDDTYRVDDQIGFEVTFDNFPDGDTIMIDLLETCTRDNLFGSRNLAVLGNEIISFQTITPIMAHKYRIEGIFRGRFDTSVEAHAIGTHFWFLATSLFHIVKSTSLFKGATRHFKYVPFSSRYTEDIATATPINETIVCRAQRPYIPSLLQANDKGIHARYTGGGDVILKWRARIRGGSWVNFESNVPTSYEGHFEIEVWVASVLVRTTDPIDDVTWTYTDAMNVADNGTPADEVVFKLINYDDTEGTRFDSEQVVLTVKKE